MGPNPIGLVSEDKLRQIHTGGSSCEDTARRWHLHLQDRDLGENQTFQHLDLASRLENHDTTHICYLSPRSMVCVMAALADYMAESLWVTVHLSSSTLKSWDPGWGDNGSGSLWFTSPLNAAGGQDIGDSLPTLPGSLIPG